MEQDNKIQRSKVWKQIYNVVKQIPREENVEDAPDTPSVATELEELFLKLLPSNNETKLKWWQQLTGAFKGRRY